MKRCIAGIAALAVVLISLTGTPVANAALFDFIRIGDADGFGYGTGAGWKAANGGPANVGGGGILQTLDYLPDISRTLTNNRYGTLTGSHDDFDLRNSEGINGSDFIDLGTSGEQFTDISLSTSYDASFNAGNVLVSPDANLGTKGTGGTFPLPPSNTLPNQPGFVFDFFVAAGDIVEDTPLYFNLVFGDYDVSPATVRVTNGSTVEHTPTLQQNSGGEDGLIQAAYVALDFDTVFSAYTHNGVSGWRGQVDVYFLAGSEPYTAFDYVEIGTTAIPTNPAPEPTTLIIWSLLGLCGITYGWRRRKA